MSDYTSKSDNGEKESRKALIRKSFEKAIKQNGKALRKLAKFINNIIKMG